MSTRLWIDVIGWVGALALLVAYALVSQRRVAGDAISYQFLNLGGSMFLLLNAAYYGAYPSSFVNVLWAGIGMYTLARSGRGIAGG